MGITRNRSEGMLLISQKAYIKKVINKFSQANTKQVIGSLTAHFKLSAQDSPKTDQKRVKMGRILYVAVVGSMMYYGLHQIGFSTCY